MQKVVLDTNVLVSSLIQKGYPYLIIHDIIFENEVILCISEELIGEYYEVLKRTKFSKYRDFIANAEMLLAIIEESARKYSPKIKLNILSDKDDNKLLELATECNANFLITGNTNDFTIQKYKRTKIVTPKEYWESYRP